MNAAIGLFNATLMSAPIWGLLYVAVHLLIG
jgi:hypothetical protein